VILLVTLAGACLLAMMTGARVGRLGRLGSILVCLFLLFATISLVSLLNERTTSEGVAMWVKVFAFPALSAVICLLVVRGAEDVERTYRFLLAGISLAAGYGIVEYLIGRNILLQEFGQQVDATYQTAAELGSGLAYRIFSVYAQPLEFATALGMILPFALVRFATSPTMRQKLVFAAAVILCALGIVLTYSRGPVLAMVVSVGIIVLIYRSLRPWLVSFGVIGVIAAAAAWPFIGDGLSNRLQDIENVTMRLKLWEIAFALFTDYPLRGIGFGNFPEYYVEAARIHMIGPIYEFGQEGLEGIRVAENTYVQLAAETGVFGFLAAVAAIVAFFRLVLRLRRHARDAATRDLAVAIGVGATAYLVNGLTITAYTIFVPTFLLVGFLFPFALVLHRSEIADRLPPTSE
jgi:O-antigen ligase